jgi:microcystin-dependent protein
MSDPYVGEIRRFPYEQIPQGWLPCDGQVVSATQYSALYELIQNSYGGEASSTFALPNLQGAIALSQGGTAGAVGEGIYVPGPKAAFQVVCFAIAVEDAIYPPIQQSEEK